MSKIFAYIVLAFLALFGSVFSCAHGGMSSPNGSFLMPIARTLLA